MILQKKIFLFTSYNYYRFRLKQDGVWCDVDLQNTSILEIHFPVESLVIKSLLPENTDISQDTVREDIVIECTQESTAQLLALAVDHIDILLEDWYPTLGTRFVHTSEGRFLVTRLVPCPKCLQLSVEVDQNSGNTDQGKNLAEFGHVESDPVYYGQHRIRKSQESYTSECDSGVGPDSAESSRMPSMEGHPGFTVESSNSTNNLILYSWMVEECILAAYSTKCVSCPIHFDILLSLVAPDTVTNLNTVFILKLLSSFFSLGLFRFR